MSRRSRRLKRAALREVGKGEVDKRELIDSLTTSIEVPGGMVGALARGANGSASLKDVDFLNRVRNEMRGRNGYSGEDKRDRKGKKDNYTFSVSNNPTLEDGVFKCEESGEVTDKCPLKPKVPHILMSAIMWDTFLKLTKVYDVEWIALLLGKLGKDSKGEDAYLIDKYYFPPQTASGAHVDVPTGVKPRVGTIGAIHSHVNMGVFWSGTDKDHSNWPVEIVINRKAEYKALARYQLKCGEWAKSEADVYLEGSSLSAVVKAEMDKAFAKGLSLSKPVTSSVTSSITIPSSIHPEDRRDVIGALMCVCGHPRDQHYNNQHYNNGNLGGWVGGCKTCKPCQRFELAPSIPSTPSSTSTPTSTLSTSSSKYCPSKSVTGNLCAREKGHRGMCKTFRGDYLYSYSPDSDKEEDKEEGKQGSIGWPPFDGLTPPNPDTPVIDISDPPEQVDGLVENDPTVTEEDKWDCKTCQGKGWYADESGIAKECEVCGGDGMTVEGRGEWAKKMAN